MSREMLAQLEQITHPPAPRDMRVLCEAALEDDDIDRANRIARTMLDHHTYSAGADHMEFYFWLGAGAMTRALAEARYRRSRERSDRKWRRAGVMP